MPNNNCAVELNFIANDINVNNLYMIGDEISDKNKNKWSSYKSYIKQTKTQMNSLEIEAKKLLFYVANDFGNNHNDMFDIIDENGDMSYDWFKFMVKYIPILFDRSCIYTLLVDNISFGTSKDWYNLFIHSSKKIDNKIKQHLIGTNKTNKIDITLSVCSFALNVSSPGKEKSSSRSESRKSEKKQRRSSIFSDNIPERRHSDTFSGKNYKGKCMNKHYNKRLSEPRIQYESSNFSQTANDEEKTSEFKMYNKKDYRTWLIKNHPTKDGDRQVFQMYRRIHN